MDKELRNQHLKNLNLLIKELALSSNKLSYEERFDVASLRNNIHNL